jgi:hypothetical protein
VAMGVKEFSERKEGFCRRVLIRATMGWKFFVEEGCVELLSSG